MSNYFDEMGWQPLAEGETPNHFLHMARLLLDYNMFDELGENHRLPPPASKKAVTDMETIVIQHEEEQCPVCIKSFVKEEVVKRMPCTHRFHINCLLPWLAKTNSCPLCRYELPTDDVAYEAYRKEKLRAKEREKDLEILHNSMFS